MGKTYKDRRLVDFGKKNKINRKRAIQHKEEKNFRNHKNLFRDVLGEMKTEEHILDI